MTSYPNVVFDFVPYARNVVACLGDSRVYNGTLGVRAFELFPYQLASMVNAQLQAAAEDFSPLKAYKARNFGRSGDSTNMLFSPGRLSLLNNWEVPDICVVLAGTNDYNSGRFGTVQASPAPTSSAFTVSTGVGVSMPVGSYVVINGVPGFKITSQSGDALIISPSYVGIAAGQTVTPDTQTNLQAIVQAVNGMGCGKVIIVGEPYLNWSTGGDTTSSQASPYGALRTAQRAAATASGAPYADVYEFCRRRILTGVDVQGSHTYHVLDLNVHPSAYGSQVIADCLYQTITSQPQWL